MFHKARYLIRKVTKDQYEQNNIFMTQNHEPDEQQFFKDGKVVPYLLVGNPKQFIKTKLEGDTKPYETTKEKVSKRVIRNNFIHESKEDSFIQQDMDASEVEREIERVIHNQNKKEPGPKVILSQADQKYVEKDQKIIDKFYERQKVWDRRIVQSAQSCKRDPKQSLFQHIDANRIKVEDKKLLDLVQTDAERYGNKLWEYQLRKSSNPEDQIQQGMEFIRKPNQLKIYERPDSISKRLEERKSVVDKLGCYNSVENLQILGENILVKESAQLLYQLKLQSQHRDKSQSKSQAAPTSKRKQTLSSAPFKKIVQREQPLYYQEVLAMNYDKRKLRQQGRLDICKQVF